MRGGCKTEAVASQVSDWLLVADVQRKREREREGTHVDDDRRLVPPQTRDGLKNLLTLSRLEHTLAIDLVELGVPLGVHDALRVDLDPCDVLEMGRERDGEQAGAAVGVNQVGRQRLDRRRGRRLKDRLPDVVGQGGQDRVVVLEEGAGGEDCSDR